MDGQCDIEKKLDVMIFKLNCNGSRFLFNVYRLQGG
jgi:hypothetical protein